MSTKFRGQLPKALLLALFCALAGACTRSAGSMPVDEIRASGFLEGRTYRLSTDAGGLVTALFVEQGRQIQTGQKLVELDGTGARHEVAQAEAAVTAAQTALQSLRDPPGLETEAAAMAGISTAKAELASAQASLSLLLARYLAAGSIVPEDEQLIAQGAIDIARANVVLAEAKAKQLMVAPGEAEIAESQAKLLEAQAAMRLAEFRLRRLTILAPIDGIVQNVLRNNGEVATPGSVLIELTDPRELNLVVYVPTSQVPHISIGDAVEIATDSHPDRLFAGRVVRIADEAQFTPTAVQTQEERVSLVFAVYIQVESPSGLLSAGMPADVVIQPKPN